jgi:hypothetical protein
MPQKAAITNTVIPNSQALRHQHPASHTPIDTSCRAVTASDRGQPTPTNPLHVWQGVSGINIVWATQCAAEPTNTAQKKLELRGPKVQCGRASSSDLLQPILSNKGVPLLPAAQGAGLRLDMVLRQHVPDPVTCLRLVSPGTMVVVATL